MVFLGTVGGDQPVHVLDPAKAQGHVPGTRQPRRVLDRQLVLQGVRPDPAQPLREMSLLAQVGGQEVGDPALSMTSGNSQAQAITLPASTAEAGVARIFCDRRS